MTEEQIKLILSIQGATTLEEAKVGAERLRASLKETADAYEVLERQVGTYQVATDRLDKEVDEAVRKAHELVLSQKAVAAALGDVPPAMQATASALTSLKGTKSAGGGGLLGASYGLQDFITVLSVGGEGSLSRALMSTTNNLTPMLIGLGLGSGFAGVAGLAFTAVVALAPQVAKLGEVFGGIAKVELPGATDRVESLTAALKKDREAVEELTKAGKVYGYQLDEHRDRLEKIKRQEQELADARLARSIGPDDSKAGRARAGAFREAVEESGGSDEVVTMLMNLTGMSRAAAEATVAGGLRGERGAGERVRERLGMHGGRRRFGFVAPEDKAHDAVVDQIEEEQGRRIRQDREQERRRVEQLNEQGRRNADAARQGRERDEERRVRDSMRLGRAVGAAANRGDRAPAKIGHVPLIPEDGTPDQMMNAQVQGRIIMNQQAMTETMEALRRSQEIQNRNRRIVQDIRRGAEQNPQAGGLQR